MSPAEEHDSDGFEGKSKVARPDEMPDEVIEFLHAIDEYKRTKMMAQLSLDHILAVVHELGYERPGRSEEPEREVLGNALDRYRRAHKRLFPNWSEIFEVLREIGYAR
jgi:hypothetical protein